MIRACEHHLGAHGANRPGDFFGVGGDHDAIRHFHPLHMPGYPDDQRLAG
jgi:hypothetical protein